MRALVWTTSDALPRLPLGSSSSSLDDAAALEQDQLSAARQGQHCHLTSDRLGLAAAGRPSKRWEEVGNIADRLLETDLRSQLMIWPFTTAFALA
jgi:hypothetical protein